MIKKLSAIALVFAQISAAYSQDAAPLGLRLHAEAPKKFEEFVKLAKTMKCRGVDKMIDSDTKQIVRQSAFRNALSGDLALAVGEVEIQGPEKYRARNGSLLNFAVPARVVGKNARYSFRLSHQKPERDWALAAYAPAEKIPKSSTLGRIDDDVLGTFTIHFWMRTVNLPALLRDPTFVLKGGEFLAGAKPGLARIVFSYGVPGSNSPPSEGYMILDTEHYWCISEYAIKIGSGDSSWNQKVTNEYDVDKDGVPLWTRHVAIDTSSYLNVETITENRIERHSGIPAREFTLTAFGLPEPMGMPSVDRGGFRWYIWFFVAAVGAFAAGLVSRKLLRRPTRPTAAQK